MKRIMPILAVCLIWPAITQAASFDCARAASKVEKQICADPTLSRDDEALANAYAKALAATPEAVGLRQDQRGWIAGTRDKAATAAAMHTAITERIATLTTQAQADTDAARPVPLADIAAHCVTPSSDMGACTVENTGRLRNTNLAWQARLYKDGDQRTGAGVTVFAVDGTTARPVFWRDEEDAYFEDPQILQTSAGAFLDLGGHLDGTGDMSAETVLLNDGTAWRELDISAIADGLLAHAPHGLGIWKGIYPDWQAMRVETPLWKDRDGNCCPTGGSIRGTLKRVGLRILVDQAVYDRTPGN